MWTFIIIGIIGFILFNFFKDREKDLKRVESGGGMKSKYSILLASLWDDNAELKELTRDTIGFTVKTGYYVHQFVLVHAFNKLNVTWKAKSPFSNISESWEFLENDNQFYMADKITTTMKQRLTNLSPNSDVLPSSFDSEF